MKTCPFCSRLLGTIKNHFPSCPKLICLVGTDRVAFGYERLYGISRPEIERRYLVGQQGLRTIEKETGIPYRVLQHLVSAYGIRRSATDSIRIQNEKNKEILLAKYGVKNPFEIPWVIAKIQRNRDVKAGFESMKKTMLSRYGVENPFQIPAVASKILKHQRDPNTRQKMKEWMQRWRHGQTAADLRQIRNKAATTCEKKYGVRNPFQIPAVIEANKLNEKAKAKRRDTCIRLGLWASDSEKTDFNRYFCEVRMFTRRNKTALFAGWNGRCFYTGEKLVTNAEFQATSPGTPLARNPLRPTIDHKISVIQGFKEGIPASEIGAIGNLCVCSQRVNSQKNYRTITNFLKSLENSPSAEI